MKKGIDQLTPMKNLSEGKILIVEDAEIARMILLDALKEDCDVRIAENGGEGLGSDE